MADVVRENAVAGVLAELGALDAASLEPFYPRTRDREDISVWRCARSGVIVLSRSDHVHRSFYQEKEHPELRELGDRDRVVEAHRDDTERRARSIGTIIANKRWLDVGTGSGAILDELSPRTSSAAAVEPQREFRTELSHRGYQVHERLADVAEGAFDVITMFHVLEHFTEPLAELREARRALAAGGRIVVEVPHARDALIGLYASEAFHAHTFWSEHLVLHTRASLSTLLQAAGFGGIIVEGVQRYSVVNHLHWLARGRPAGHRVWPMLESRALGEHYEANLAKIDATDTLVATATQEAP